MLEQQKPRIKALLNLSMSSWYGDRVRLWEFRGSAVPQSRMAFLGRKLPAPEI